MRECQQCPLETGGGGAGPGSGSKAVLVQVGVGEVDEMAGKLKNSLGSQGVGQGFHLLQAGLGHR